MVDEFWNYVARKPRHPGRESEDVSVEVDRLDGGSPDQLAARLINVSRGGMQVAVSIPLLVGENVHLRLLDKHAAKLDMEAVVCWVRLAHGEQGWHAGLRFVEELEFDALGELFLDHLIETE